MLTRRMMLGGLLAGVALPALGETMATSPRPMPRPGSTGGGHAAGGVSSGEIADLITAAKLGGEVAFVLVDGKSGDVLDSRNPDLPLPPASVAKTVTSLFALEKLGAGFRFKTRVLATGPVSGGIVQGDLVLVGGGDPTLQTDQLGDLVARLAADGLKGATGRFLYWEGALPQLTEIAADQPEHVGYNAAISGLNLNFNRAYFEWKKSGGDWTCTVDARGDRFVPVVEMVEVSVAKRDAPLFTYKAGKVEKWTVASSALGKDGSRWLPVRDPGAYVAEVFRTLARAQGIKLDKADRADALPAGTELGRVESEALPDLLQDMLKFSTNLTAECVGLASSGQGGLKASAKVMSDWVRQVFGVAFDMHDHSGLGGTSRVTAAGMAQMLVQAEREKRGLKPILKEVGMKDDKGNVIEGSKVKVVAKSGTLNFVSALAGYIVPPGGRELVFAIFTGDPARRDAVPVALREEPEGGHAWTKRSRRLQGQLINRWAGAYG